MNAIVQNLDRPTDMPAHVRVCNSYGSRLRGLMFQSRLLQDQGILLVGSADSRLDSAIHMLFMRFDIAVIWINSQMDVVDKTLARAWRAAYVPSQPAMYVLEVHPVQFSAYDVNHRVKITYA